MAKPDKLLLAAKAAAIWFIKFCDYGEESVNYENGDSSVFTGTAEKDAKAIKLDLQAALASKGIDIGELVKIANSPPHTCRTRD